MALNILRVIWLMIHMLYSAIQHIVFIWINIRKKCEKLLCQDSMPVTDDMGYMAISKHAKMLVKVPVHVAIIIGDEAISINDLANITIWCIAAGISCISFYDHNGLLKKVDTDLYAALTNLGKLGTLCLDKIRWGNKPTSSMPNHVPTKNGNGTNGYNMQRLTVNIFSLSDCKDSLVEVAKSLHPSISAVDLKISEINVKLINSLLQKSLNIPEVDLTICCGNTFSTYGFLPWHTRVSEFSQLRSHHNLRVKDFVTLLDVYSKCSQRFGK